MLLDISKLAIKTVNGGVEFQVKVVPGASRSKIAGVWGAGLRLTVAAPPAGGQANAAVAELLAQVLGVATSAVRIVRGQANPVKQVLIAGCTVAQVSERLAALS